MFLSPLFYQSHFNLWYIYIWMLFGVVSWGISEEPIGFWSSYHLQIALCFPVVFVAAVKQDFNEDFF